MPSRLFSIIALTTGPLAPIRKKTDSSSIYSGHARVMKMFNGVFLDVLTRILLTLLASSRELHLYRTELSGFHRPDPPKQLQSGLWIRPLWYSDHAWVQHFFFSIRLCLPRFYYAVISVSRRCSTNASLFLFFSCLIILVCLSFFSPRQPHNATRCPSFHSCILKLRLLVVLLTGLIAVYVQLASWKN